MRGSAKSINLLPQSFSITFTIQGTYNSLFYYRKKISYIAVIPTVQTYYFSHFWQEIILFTDLKIWRKQLIDAKFAQRFMNTVNMNMCRKIIFLEIYLFSISIMKGKTKIKR